MVMYSFLVILLFLFLLLLVFFFLLISGLAVALLYWFCCNINFSGIYTILRILVIVFLFLVMRCLPAALLYRICSNTSVSGIVQPEAMTYTTIKPNLKAEVTKQMRLRLRVLVNRKTKQVLFVESGRDFVDVLCSFLTLPMGTVVRLADKGSGLGSIDALYRSVEALNQERFQTTACKTMLLEPRSAYAVPCENLGLKIDNTEPAKHFTCRNFFCSNPLVSVVRDSRCVCGQTMDKEVYLNFKDKVDMDGVFIKGMEKFMVSDDLKISPASLSTSLSFLQEIRFDDETHLEERYIDIGVSEVLQLLKCAVVSRTPLTDALLSDEQYKENLTLSRSSNIQDQCQGTKSSSTKKKKFSCSKKMTVKLLLSKSTNRVLCVETKEDFIDLIFSFLTFPLGSIVKLLSGHSSMGSIDNLYKSVKDLAANDFLKSKKCKEILLSPKLANKFGCKNQLLQIEEESPLEIKGYKCQDCLWQEQDRICIHSHIRKLKIMNPKLPGMTRSGGGFVKEGSLLATDDLRVEPLSPISGMHQLRNLHVPLTDLEEQWATVGEKEALNLLKASLISKNVLSQVF